MRSVFYRSLPLLDKSVAIAVLARNLYGLFCKRNRATFNIDDQTSYNSRRPHYRELFDDRVESVESTSPRIMGIHMFTFFELHREGWRIEPVHFVQALSSCAGLRDLLRGELIHCLGISAGMTANVHVGSCLVNLYVKCRRLHDAQYVFDEMPEKNVVSWTTLISGFAQCSHGDRCLDLYREMVKSHVKPNAFTLTVLLSGVGGSCSLGQGRNIHSQTIHLGFHSSIPISNALISMYCRCGHIEDAIRRFTHLPVKDNVSWNSMLTGYAHHGLVQEAIGHFEKMKQEGVKPNSISFLAVLSCCRHVGLVEKGKHYFDLMRAHSVEPGLDHYSCMVDLLSRMGCLEGSQKFIEGMPVLSNEVVWGSLLSSCRIHGNACIGVQAAERSLSVKPHCASTHVQLANLYARSGFLNQAARVRKTMKEKGLKTKPGCSWIEIKNRVFVFRADDWSGSRSSEIMSAIGSLQSACNSYEDTDTSILEIVS